MKKAICVLSAGIKKNKKGEWASTDFIEDDDKFGAPGGKLRVAAASYLHKDNSNISIIASGGRGRDIRNDESSRPDLADILTRELKDFGVPESCIIKENKSNKTIEQLKELKLIMSDKNLDELIVITNDYHLPRIKAILEHDNELRKLPNDCRIVLRSAEEICLQYNREKWHNIIKEAYESEEMKRRMEMEAKGVEQIKNGTYIF